MSRWVVRAPHTKEVSWSDVTVKADWLDLDHGVLVFYADEEQSTEVPKGSPTYDGRQAKWVQRHETVTETVSTLVRAFGVGQWRDVEPLAEPPEEPGMLIHHSNGVSHLEEDGCTLECTKPWASG